MPESHPADPLAPADEFPAEEPVADDLLADEPPVRSLTVLYDAQCALCRHVRGWLERQWQLVPLEFVPAGSAEAARRFPDLDHARTLREITVISDVGEVYEGSDAWLACLWALKGRRATAYRFSTPTGARLARGAVLAAAKWREASRPTSNGTGGVRPTAPGRAGRTPASGSPSTPVGPWTWNGKNWEPSAPTAEPCGEHCAPPPG